MGATLVSHPADVLKVRMQLLGEGNARKPTLQLRDYANAGRQLAAKEGLRRGLYGGLSASLLRHSIFSTLRHGLFKVVEESSGGLGAAQRLGVSVCTGALAGAIANPVDLVLIRMQADGGRPAAEQRRYRHALHGLASVVRQEGIRACWTGVSPCVVRAILVTASQISAYGAAKPLLETHCGLQGLPLQLSAAAFSGATACIVTCPVDVVKTRIMQMNTADGLAKYSGPIDVVVQTFRTEGPLAFYKGLSATLLRLFPHTIVLWLVQEQVDAALKKHCM